MTYTANTVFDSLELAELVTLVEQDDTLPIQDTMVCALSKNVTGMSPCAKDMNLITGKDTEFTGNRQNGQNSFKFHIKVFQILFRKANKAEYIYTNKATVSLCVCPAETLFL